MNPIAHLRCLASFSVPAALVLALAPPAQAQLDIVLDYAAGKSHDPKWDVGGSHLAAILSEAASRWEAIYSGVPATTIRVRFRWYDPWRDPFGLTPAESCSELATTRRRLGAATPNSYEMSFWVNNRVVPRKWYVDAEPADHGEFDLAPRMYLDPSESTTWVGVSGAPPGALELGCEGSARTLESKVGASGSSSGEGFDLYSVALHELGHALGLGFRGESDPAADSDYDIPASLPGGGFGLLVCPDLETGAVDPGHLLTPHALMNDVIDHGVRKLPGYADVLAIAHINGWTSFHPRRVLWDLPGASATWGLSTAWLPEHPNATRGAVIHPLIGATEIQLLASSSAESVFLGQGVELGIGAVTLQAGQLLALAGDASIVASGSTLQATYLRHAGGMFSIQGGGQLSIASRAELTGDAGLYLTGSAGAQARLLAAGATLRLLDESVLGAWSAEVLTERLFLASETSRVEGGSTVFRGLMLLENGGVLVASNGDLRFEPSSGGVMFDLDGTLDERGRLSAIGGSLDFRAPLSDPFEGTIEIAAGHMVRLAGGAQLGGGSILLSGDEARVVAPLLDLALGVIHAEGPSPCDARIVAQQLWRGAYAEAALGTLLHLQGPSSYSGGAPLIGAGGVRQAGDATVSGAATTYIQVDNYFWDGEDPLVPSLSYSTTRVQSGAALRITGNISCGALDGFDGVVVLESGATLTLDRDWILEGRIELAGGTIATGGRITNRGVIEGFGRIETQVVNDGAIVGEGSGIEWLASWCYIPGSGTCSGPGCP